MLRLALRPHAPQRCVSAGDIGDAFWGAGSGETNASELSVPAVPGEVDFFVSEK